MKNIAFVISNLGGGGAERVVLTLAKQLSLLGCNVHVIVLENRIDYTVDKYYQLHLLHETGKITHIRSVDFYLLALKLRKLLKRIEKQGDTFDLIVSNLIHTDKVVSLSKLKNCVYVLHSTASRELASIMNRSKRKRRKQSFIKIYRNKNLIAVSNNIAKDFIKTFGEMAKNISIIYNPFDIVCIRNKSLELNAHVPEEPYIIYVGRVDVEKRLDVLLAAFSKITSECKLVLLTHPKEWLHREIYALNLTDKVILPGFQKNPYPWIKQAKLLVLTSDYEGFGNVIVESLICDTPVVSTDCPSGPSEILTDKLACWLVPMNDPDALAAKIDEALQMDISLKDFDFQRFDVKKISEQYLGLANIDN